MSTKKRKINNHNNGKKKKNNPPNNDNTNYYNSNNNSNNRNRRKNDTTNYLKNDTIIGFMMYGKINPGYIENLRSWGDPTTVIIISVKIPKLDVLEQYNAITGEVCPYKIHDVSNELIDFLVSSITENRHKLQFISDVLRWYGLQHILSIGMNGLVVEGDTQCLHLNQFKIYCSHLKDITIFGTDRAAIYVPIGKSKQLNNILNLFQFIFDNYLSKENYDIYGSQVMEKIYDEFTGKSKMIHKPWGTVKDFLDAIPFSFFGILIRNYHKDLEFQIDENAEGNYYVHKKTQTWVSGGTKKRKRNKKTRKKSITY